MRTGPTNIHLQSLIATLKKHSHTSKSPIWMSIAIDLEKSTRERRIVNLNKINRFTEQNETIIVPGKVLGTGILEHSVTVAAWSFSQSAKNEIEKAKGKCLSIQDLLQQNPQGKKVRVFG